jgi:UDPglucose 6-dehydrogenase
MRLLIVGDGVVGGSVSNALQHNHKITKLDPPKGLGHDVDLFDLNLFDGVIICVPTPANRDGSCDDLLVHNYINQIRVGDTDIPILLKSTTSIETLELYQNDPHLTFNPEFLTESNAHQEFLNQRFAIFGGAESRFWYELIVTSGVSIGTTRFTDIMKAGYAKYAINTFLATKVVFFNELKAMYGGSDFDMLTDLIGLDDRVGSSHMMVPGPDGSAGYGGMCFPKDTNALLMSSKRKGHELTLLGKVIEINNELRND